VPGTLSAGRRRALLQGSDSGFIDGIAAELRNADDPAASSAAPRLLAVALLGASVVLFHWVVLRAWRALMPLKPLPEALVAPRPLLVFFEKTVPGVAQVRVPGD
jgi:hypothetical protein